MLKNPRIHIQTAAYHIGTAGAKLQHPFDVAIIIPTIMRPELEKTLDSIFKQDFNGRIQILIGVDKSKKDRNNLLKLFSTQPDNCITTILDLGYSTSIRHGGLRKAADGGSLRTILSYMANSRYIAYLDDDNWWGKNHLSSLLKSIKGVDWTYSLRWYVDARTKNPQCIDKWESTGVNSGVFKKKFGGWVDPNCLLIDSIKCEPVLRNWLYPLKGDKKGMSADRNIFNALSKSYKFNTTNQATCYYIINPKDLMHIKRLNWIKESKK